jgi:prepilin-type N-terminal cleavage/methylation domain-containing protein
VGEPFLLKVYLVVEYLSHHMKPTENLTMTNKRGMTLLELTVVILVLLSLISILAIGTRAWKKGSDRAANILNIRNVQQAVRAHANTYELAVGTPLVETQIVGPGRYFDRITSPNLDITYVGKFNSSIPPVGTLYLTPDYINAVASSEFAPVVGSYSEW